MLLTILFIVIFVFILYRFFKAYRLPNNNIICFTGTLGSGKTYLAVSQALRAYKRQRLKHFIYKKIPVVGRLIRFVFPESVYPASLYSNIPIQINLSRRKPKYALPLTREHLLMLDILPERCVVLIDELGQVCSQWEFDNPLVMQNVQTLVRFFRHFTNGKMFVTDQVSSNIVKPIRDRLGYVYQLNDFHRDFFILPFFKVDCIPLQNLDDGGTNIEADLNDLEKFYFYGFLPYKFLKMKHYESRCFRKLYTDNAVRKVHNYNGLYTTYLMDISVSQETRKQYKKDLEKFRAFLYDRQNVLSSSDSSVDSAESPNISLDDLHLNL